MIPRDLNGNRVKEVHVSAASRNDAHGGNSRQELVKAIEDLEGERLSWTARKGQATARLTQIKNSIRGRHLPAAEYDALTKEQSTLVAELHDLDAKLADGNTRLHRLRRDLRDHNEDGLAATNVILNAILRSFGL